MIKKSVLVNQKYFYWVKKIIVIGKSFVNGTSMTHINKKGYSGTSTKVNKSLKVTIMEMTVCFSELSRGVLLKTASGPPSWKWAWERRRF